MKKAASETGRPGFTLVELLVVIAVISILMAIVVPSVTSAIERAKRAKCLVGMKGLGQALIGTAQDSRDRMPALHVKGSPWPYWFAQSDLFKWAESQGLKRNDFYCPSNPDWNRDGYWWYGGANANTVIGYMYLGDDGRWATNSLKFPGVPQSVSLVFAQRLSDAPHYRQMLTDLTRRYAGDWGNGANHRQLLGPYAGVNEIMIDGSGRWVGEREVALRINGPSNEMYW